MKKFKNSNIAILILRIFVGSVFITHGVMKLVSISGTESFFQMLGIAPWLGVVVGVVEVLAGLSMILGFFTFGSAIAIIVIMLVAIFKVKLPMGGIMAAEVDISLLVSALVIFMVGAGKYSLGNNCGCVGNCGCDSGVSNKKCNDENCTTGKICIGGDCGCSCHK